MISGSDISEFQPDINWDEYKANKDFVIIRSSFGTARADYQFGRNQEESRRVSIPHGYYHYAYPNQNSATDEANFFVKNVGALQEGEVLCLDFEEAYGDPVNWCLNFLTVVQQSTGVHPLLYINASLATSYDWTPVAKDGYGLWLAEWNENPGTTSNIPSWDIIALHQYSDQGSVPGVPGRVDLDVFYGDVEGFKRYGYTATPAPPPQPEPPISQPGVPPAPVEPPVQPGPPSSPEPSPEPLPTPSQPPVSTPPTHSELITLIHWCVEELKKLFKL